MIATSPMRVIKLTHWEIRRMSEDTLDRIKEIIRERQDRGVADPAYRRTPDAAPIPPPGCNQRRTNGGAHRCPLSGSFSSP